MPPSKHPATASCLPRVTAKELDNIDRSLLLVVKKGLTQVGQVMDGKRSWSNTQFRIFSKCLDKVRPDIKSTSHHHTIEHKKIDELTKDEILARLHAEEEKAQVIEHEAITIEDGGAEPLDPDFAAVADKVLDD